MTTVIWAFAIVLITGLAVWFDYRAYQKKGRVLLIVLSGLLMLGFIYEPKWWSVESASYALITDGFESDKFSSNKYEEVYSLRSEDKYRSGRKWLSSVAMLTDEIPSGSGVDLLGFGTEEELPENYQWFDKLSNPGDGFILTSAPKQVEVGKNFEISLKVDGAGNRDSIQIYKDTELWESRKIDSSGGEITFQDQLNMQGPVTYDIEWLNGDSLYTESLYVRAIQAQLLTFGVLIYSPSFEINYLTEHFGNRGHSVISRTRVGQGRFRFDAINARSNQAESIIENLASMDILILDSREYAELSISDKNQIKESVQNGLDVLLRSPGSEESQEWAEVFSEIANSEVTVQNINRLEERNWMPNSVQENEGIISPYPLLNINFVELPEAGKMLHDNVGKEVVSARIQNGSGSVSGHLFYQTYGWLLEGNEEAYNRFWVDYLSRVIALEQSRVEVSPSVQRINEKMKIFITQPSEIINVMIKPVFSTDSLRVPVVQNSENPKVATASYWPQDTGWHSATYGDLKLWFYVYADQWRHDHAVRKFRETKNEITTSNSKAIPAGTPISTKVPQWIWLMGFLVLQITVWAERKIS